MLIMGQRNESQSLMRESIVSASVNAFVYIHNKTGSSVYCNNALTDEGPFTFNTYRPMDEQTNRFLGASRDI